MPYRLNSTRGEFSLRDGAAFDMPRRRRSTVPVYALRAKR